MADAEAYTTIRIYIKREQHSQLKELAGAAEVSVSWVIRRAIEEYLATHTQQREDEK